MQAIASCDARMKRCLSRPTRIWTYYFVAFWLGAFTLTGAVRSQDLIRTVHPSGKLANGDGAARSGMRCVRFNPAGDHFAICGTNDLKVKVWRWEDRKLVLETRNETGTVDFDPTGKLLASGKSNVVSVLRAATGETIWRVSLSSGVAGIPLRVAFSSDGKQIAAQDSVGGIRLYDVATEKTRFHFQESAPTLFQFLPKSNDLAIINSSWAEGDSRRIYHVDAYDRDSAKRRSKPLANLSELGLPYSLDFNADGSRLAVCGLGRKRKEGVCLIFDTANGQLLHKFRAKTGPLWCAKFSHDGEFVATGGAAGRLVLWNTITGNSIWNLPGHRDTVRSVDFHPEGRQLVSVAEDGFIMFWEVPAPNARQRAQ